MLLKEMSKVLRDNRDELLDLSTRNTGTTKADGSFDVDGGSGTLAYYFALGKGLGDRTFLTEGDGVQLAKTDGFYGRHILVPRHGVAVHINAFNFPVWGFAEKAACALLAGMPVITKPATATSMVTERAIELIVQAGFLPEGALQLIVGSTGDLLDRLGRPRRPRLHRLGGHRPRPPLAGQPPRRQHAGEHRGRQPERRGPRPRRRRTARPPSACS